MNNTFLLILISLLITSCGSKEDDIENAVLRANLALTSGNCKKAISILEAEGDQPDNVDYIKTYASAYACSSGYTTTNLFSEDIDKIDDPQLLLRSLSSFSTSTMDSLESTSYIALQKALDKLLYAGGIALDTDPTSDDRSAYFGTDALDVNSFAFYLSLVQLGNFSYYFGNASKITGIKGTGNITNTNPCYLDYNANVNTFLGVIGSTGVCVFGSDEGHPELVSGVDSVNVENACKGIVLFNNLMDTLNSFLATFTGDDFDDLSNLSSIVDLLGVGITTVKPTFDTRIFDVTSQVRCESLFASNDEDIMYFYAAVFETLHR